MHLIRHSNVRDLAFSRDGRRLASVGENKLRVWDVEDGRCVFEETFANPPCSLYFPGPHTLFVGHDNGELRLLEIGRAKDEVIDRYTGCRVTGMTGYENDLFLGLEHGYGVSAEVVQRASSGVSRTLVSHNPGGGVWFLVIEPIRRQLAALVVDGHWMEYVGFWLIDLRLGNVLTSTLAGTLNGYGCLEFTTDGNVLAGPDPIQGDRLRLFAPTDVANGQCVSWCSATEGTSLPGGWLAVQEWHSFGIGTLDERLGFAGGPSNGPERTCLRRSITGLLASCADRDTVQVISIDELLGTLRDDESPPV
jgi:hypothetical protein